MVSEEDIDEGEETMHTVTFKCVGSVHDSKAQEVLAEVRHSKAEDSTPVRVEEEPSNPMILMQFVLSAFSKMGGSELVT